MKLHELVVEGKTDGVAGAASSNSVMSQALHPLMVSRSLATPRAVNPVPPESHAMSRLGGARLSSPELPLMMDAVATSPIDLTRLIRPWTLPSQCGNALGAGRR
jgi:hypothetical protein